MSGRLVNFRADPDLDARIRNTATRLGVGYSAITRACIRHSLPLLDANDVEILDDPELRGARVLGETRNLLDG